MTKKFPLVKMWQSSRLFKAVEREEHGKFHTITKQNVPFLRFQFGKWLSSGWSFFVKKEKLYQVLIILSIGCHFQINLGFVITANLPLFHIYDIILKKGFRSKSHVIPISLMYIFYVLMGIQNGGSFRGRIYNKTFLKKIEHIFYWSNFYLFYF